MRKNEKPLLAQLSRAISEAQRSEGNPYQKSETKNSGLKGITRTTKDKKKRSKE